MYARNPSGRVPSHHVAIRTARRSRRNDRPPQPHRSPAPRRREIRQERPVVVSVARTSARVPYVLTTPQNRTRSSSDRAARPPDRPAPHRLRYAKSAPRPEERCRTPSQPRMCSLADVPDRTASTAEPHCLLRRRTKQLPIPRLSPDSQLRDPERLGRKRRLLASQPESKWWMRFSEGIQRDRTSRKGGEGGDGLVGSWFLGAEWCLSR